MTEIKCAYCGIMSEKTDMCPVCGNPMKKKPAAKPTLEQFKKYQAAYDYFNRTLFGNTLNPCFLVFHESKKKKNGIMQGYFWANQWTKGDSICHEISLNRGTLTRPIADVFATLVHEMVHQWQQDHGEPPRKAYHDKQWAAKMLEVGLVPSDTGHFGGKQTGQRMTHYIAEDGAFAMAYKSMPEEIKLPWTTSEALEPAKKKKEPKNRNKVKYTCKGCEANVWGKPELRVICAECEELFVEVDPD